MSFKIADIEIENNVVLAPMAGFCDSAFRTLCKEHGAGLIYTEMVNNKGVADRHWETMEMLYMEDSEKPLGVQIFGTDLDSFVGATKYIAENTECDFLDINMGCPMPKIAKKLQAGAALLKDVDRIHEILSTIVKAVHKPITVKMRIGWDDQSINAVEVAKACEDAGVSAIALHGRTREQMYTGKANWDVIRDVKKAVDTVVIGNGDVFCPQSAKAMMDHTGVDAVMVGRASRGNPWIFKQIAEYLNTGEIIPPPTAFERVDVLGEHLKRLIKLKTAKVAVREIRTHASFYLQDIPNSREFRAKLNQLDNESEIFKVLGEYKASF
ncbi:tRNA dihydrouridine synthase DusB [Francisella adeliensis]|uniref:tRNA-dihydrouridine synthase n=1 Tax=Francisella adeliensis TaxID=2007306 RepID=A0A2Z4XXM4_9GAMM|nr:tRNA dihydrouridine synthase DusB [Francisella adeliensis]AXA33519.1 tRNA dihydrouridine synthase DusB [Francisella adeliensis]MBK2084781.1 tRNA dihydrouridine synthase DusB [Francisella adeliensis]MBK2097276.1 tRNA dihydrouridine synthase DusB [Francisella adeliensis]QIW11750.1 tRNA dihydrouridine synthase DusB [Francisella adeliensis]QIW13624.1 tRNA dihydrouridine synthase DusB [Francisella adeliensis]